MRSRAGLARVLRMPPSHWFDKLAARAAQRIDRARIRGVPFSIVSNDCWGSAASQYLGVPYSSPFAGLFIPGPCYETLLTDLPRYMAAPLRFIGNSRFNASLTAQNGAIDYPIGLLGKDVEVHFMHYRSAEEAASKWQRRTSRIMWDRLRIKVSGEKDCFTPEMLDRIAQSELAPLMLVPSSQKSSSPGCVAVDEFTTDGAALLGPSLLHFDLATWLSTGEVVPSPFYHRCHVSAGLVS